MPVYEYACKACGQHHEVSQSFIENGPGKAAFKGH